MSNKEVVGPSPNLDATVVEVEASFTKGMPSFTIVGMISTSINEF